MSQECAAPLTRTCAQCGSEVSPTAKFCPECAHPGQRRRRRPPRFASPESYTPKHLAERILTSRRALEGERKQVTVLFADLKGSMELLADRDPEEARKLLDPVLEHMMEAVHRYEGTVNQVMGDGIMALFGAPARPRGPRGARLLRGAAHAGVGRSGTPRACGGSTASTIRIRVGLNSGEVVVRSIGSDLHMDYTAVGQTTHLAARMEQLADPGAILLTPETLALAEGFVQVTALGPMPVKGLADPVEVYELAGASAGALAPAGGRRARALALRRPRRRDRAAPPRPRAGPAAGAARWWPSWASPAWASRAWSASSPTPIARGLAGPRGRLGLLRQGHEPTCP